MKFKIGNTVTYKDSQVSILYGTGVVMAVTDAEYTILWARRGSKRYKRSILDEKLDDIFQRDGKQTELPAEKRLRLGTAKNAVLFNENYDREKVKSLCEGLLKSSSPNAKNVAESLAGGLFTNKVSLRPATREILRQLAELCSNRASDSATSAARQISQELFFGYVIQKSDFIR